MPVTPEKNRNKFLDLKKICRLCFGEENKNLNLFSEATESKLILEMVLNCFQINLLPDKYLPDIICYNCVSELNLSNNFRLKCVNNKERFIKFCDSINPSCDDGDDFQSEFEGVNDISNLPKNTDTKYKCEICKKVLKTTQSLMKHTMLMHERRRHPGKVVGYGSSRRYLCTTCPYSTPHSQTLVNHMRRHNGERPFSCDCGKKFTQMSSLTAHQKIHSQITFFTCSQCGKQFKHAFSLKKHQRVHENGQFDCKICKKVLKSNESLQAHIKRHYKINNYNCEQCGDTFVTSAELYNHKMKHNSVKQLKCNLCCYTTNSKKNISVHLKRHMGERTFKCNYCEKAFYTQGDLKRHMRVHTREKPYSCQTCTQRFAYSSSLNKHMLVVHGVPYKWNDVKNKESVPLDKVK